MDLTPAGTGRIIVGLSVMALLGLAAWLQMDDTKYRTLVFVMLGFFAVRILLGRRRSR